MGPQRVHDAEEHPLRNRYAPKEQDEDKPMDIGTLQDIFSFQFFRGRPIFNFIIAVLWSIGLPILLYHVLRPHIGQVLAMIVASAPPLAIAIKDMVIDREFDPVGFVAGVSFLINGILSITQPQGPAGTICGSLVGLLVGLFCLFSLIPIRIGSFELKPIIYQLTNQIMPRHEYGNEEDEEHDDELVVSKTKRGKLDYLYRSVARFRRDMRVMTAVWGCSLIIAFLIQVILAFTVPNNAAMYGYIIFTVAPVLSAAFSYVYSRFVPPYHAPLEVPGNMEADS